MPNGRKSYSSLTAKNNPTASTISGIASGATTRKLEAARTLPRQRVIPIASPSPSGTVMIVVKNASRSVCPSAEISASLRNTEPSATYHLSDAPCQSDRDLPALNENATAMTTGISIQAM